MAPFIVGQIVDIRAASNTEVDNQRRYVENASRVMASRMGQVFAEARTLLMVLAKVPALQGATADSCVDTFRPVVEQTYWLQNLSLIQSNGVVRCTSSGIAAGVNVADRTYFKDAQARDGAVFSDLLISRASRRPTLIAASAIGARTGRPRDLIGAGVNLAWLGRGAAEGAGGQTVFLVDASDAVVARFPADGETISSGLQERLKAQFHGMTRGSFVTTTDSGEHMLFSVVPLPQTVARLVVGVSLDTAAAAAARRTQQAYLEIAAFTLLVLVLAWIGGEILLARPIRQLLNTAETITAGDLSARAKVGLASTQFIALADAFNSMAQRLEILATRDPLTGVANRRTLDRLLEIECRRADRAGMALTFAIIDVDHFKAYNDTYGHPAGDDCLRRIAAEIQRFARRAEDLAARYGGEEFALLLPGLRHTEAARHCEALRAAIEALAIPHEKSETGVKVVTISIGIATVMPRSSGTPETLISVADEALYEAKRSGRNRIVYRRIADAAEQAA